MLLPSNFLYTDKPISLSYRLRAILPAEASRLLATVATPISAYADTSLDGCKACAFGRTSGSEGRSKSRGIVHGVSHMPLQRSGGAERVLPVPSQESAQMVLLCQQLSFPLRSVRVYLST